MWFLNDSEGNRVLWLRPNQEYIIGKKNKNLKVTADKSMSRTHAVLSICGTSVIVQDSNSTHGTWVKKGNSEFKREKYILLEHNDQVRFGILTVYTVVHVQMMVSYSSVSSHDMIRLNQISSKYDLVLKKDLLKESICLICGGNVFSAKKALALVMQIPVVSLEWLYGWDDVDSYSFEIPDFDRYLPAAFQVKNEILEKDMWKTNIQRKVMFKGMEFILSGDKQNLEMTMNVITAAGGTASIQNVTRSSISRLRKAVILVCESDMIEWIKAEGLNVVAITQDDLGVAIMKGVLDVENRSRPVRPLASKASLGHLASFDLFEDPPLGKEELQAPVYKKSRVELPSSMGKNIDVFNLFDDDANKDPKNVDSSILEPRKISRLDNNHEKKPKESSVKSNAKVVDEFGIFNHDIPDNISKSEKHQYTKLPVSEESTAKARSTSTRVTSIEEDSNLRKQNNEISNRRSKKKIDLDSFFDSLLNVDDDLQSQDPAVRSNSIEDSIKQKDTITSPLKIVKEESMAPIGTLKGKTTSLAERLGFQPTPQDEMIIPSSLPPSKKYAAEPVISEGSDVVVPATPLKPRSTATVPKQIVQRSPSPLKRESNPLESKISSSMRNQELINQALERERSVKCDDQEMVDATKSLCRIIFSDSLVVNKPKFICKSLVSGMNTKRFVSNQVRRSALFAAKPPPVEMVLHSRTAIDDDMIVNKYSRKKNEKKKAWPGFSSNEENE